MSSSAIDLTNMPMPTVIEDLSFEQILSDMLADLQSRDSTFDALVESDPAYKILEVAAYRELLLRQRANDKIKALLLAYAKGADLDHIGVTYYNVERLLIDPGDPEAIPPVDPTYESDERYLYRLQLSPAGFSTAGPEDAYKFHALSADPDVRDVDPSSPAAGEILITVLSETGDGTPDQTVLDAVGAALSTRKIRPLTDEVTVQAAQIIPYTVEATLYLYDGPDPEVVRQAALTSGLKYVGEQHRLGGEVNQSGLDAALHLSGVRRVELVVSLPLPIAATRQQAPYCTGLTVVLGG